MSFTRFLDLPPELRDQVYVFHFHTTTLTYPNFTLPPLLFTSHQIHTEALPFLRPNASYNLLTSEHLLDYLTTLTPASLAQLRHISVRGVPFPIYLDNERFSSLTYGFASLLQLFPGLQLKTLEVTDAYHGADVREDGAGDNATYYDLQYLIKKSKGWKELVYTSASDICLEAMSYYSLPAGGPATRHTVGRDKQPGTWDRIIKERDGEESGAGVEMWLCKERGKWERVEGDYDAGVEEQAGQDDLDVSGEPDLSVEVHVDDGDDGDDGHDEEDAVWMRPSIMFRARRGTEAEYVQDGRVDEEGERVRDLRERFEKIGWKDIKAREMFIPGAEDDPCAQL